MATEIKLEDINQTPYLSRFRAEQDRNMVLYRPDRPLQQAELNEAQQMAMDGLAKLGDAFLGDGNLQSGMDFIKTGNELTVKDGLVYLNGRVRNFKQQTVTMAGTGREVVGVKLQRYVITSEDDPTLLDQTSGVPSAFSEGADRLQEVVILTVNDNASAPVYIFDEGELFINTENPEMDKINKVLAERTYDESGSYRVHGYDLYTEKHKTKSEEFIQLVVDGGRAYVLGYKVDKPTSTRLDLKKSKDVRSVNNEGFYYQNATRKSKLGNAPVSRVTRVTGQVRVTKETVNRGVTSGGTDFLANTSVIKVEKVWTEGANAKEFQQGTDYQVINGQSISWAPNGAEPPAGSTYFVTYIYNKAMLENTDYKITIEGEGDNREWWIDFNGMTGSKPVDETLVNVDYDFYLARTDLVVIDMNGNITIKEGQPESLRLVEAPNHLDPLTLRLGTVTVYPDSDTAIARSFSIDRLSMEDLQRLKFRVENIEYNEAVNALDQPAMAGENPLNLRGVFSDGFISLDKYDVSHPDAKIAFSFEDAEITLPYKDANKIIPKILEGDSNAHVWGRLVTAPFTEVVEIRQPFATEAINVNPYNVFNRQGLLKLEPSADNWIEEERITVTQEETSTVNIKRWWKHGSESWVQDEKNKYGNITLDDGASWTDYQGVKKGAEGDIMGTIMTSGGQQTMDSMIEFMRQIDIKIEAENLLPNTNNLQVYFDGLAIPVTPAEGYKKGSETGTGISNADGTFKGTITVPAGIRCGVREVTIRNNDNMASATYTAQGTKKTTKDIIVRTRVTISLYDPLAQSFQLQSNRVITSFGLHFASKDPNHNVIVQVRGISEGGQPNKTIYAETVLTPDKILISDDASAETKVKFDDPLMIEAGKEYCIVVITDSDKYTMWCATMGQPKIDNPTETVNSNPYLQGVLFSSSNASAWTIHQATDMKFTIYTAQFNPQATIEFDVMKNVKADNLVLMSTYLTPQSTGCVWEMKIVMENEPISVTVDDKEWRPIANYVDIDVNQVAREVKLKATFDANRFISPLLSLEDIMFVGFLTALEGSYVSRTIDLRDAPFNTVKVSFDGFMPSNTTVVPQFSLDEGKTWKSFTNPPTVTQQTQEFNKLEYAEKVATGTATYKSFKVRLNMTTQNSFLRPRAKRLMCLMKSE